MSDYKSYQQVIDLGGKAAAPVRRSTNDKVKKTTKGQKRTKTGCLTCRKRKKKCDEHIVDGKCQGCTRNFLQCSWPLSFDKSRSSSISSVSSEASTESSISQDDHIVTSYPSPKSPRIDDVSEINHIKLPPLRINQPQSQDKVVLPKIELQKSNKPQFIVTSLNQNKLCSI